MRRKNQKSYFLIFAAILVLMSLSKENSEKIRGITASFFSSSWNALSHTKVAARSFFSRFLFANADSARNSESEVQGLKLKIQLLEAELLKLQDLFGEDLQDAFDFDFDFIPAQVIFRSPSTWNSSLWINVGLESNLKAGRDIVVKNSPVVVGPSVVGVIDYVGQKQSRVRLITDSGLSPSVRVKRRIGQKDMLLAKGELYGSSGPLWRSEEQMLKGICFNCEFADTEGPARDLRTGQPLEISAKAGKLAIISVEDLLVTTGMDGVFPAGLEVAYVTKITPLKEGDYYYEINAKPVVGNLDDLSMVFVIPPLGYNPYDQPPAIGW
jgi:rod shape-determining protein MreC